MSKNLLVLGNGFDLHNELKSGFRDFFLSRSDELQPVLDFMNAFESDLYHISVVQRGPDEDEITESIRGRIIRKLRPDRPHTSYTNYEKFENLDITQLNFWDFYFQINRGREQDWYDVESQIEKFFHKQIRYPNRTQFDTIKEYIDTLEEAPKLDPYTASKGADEWARKLLDSDYKTTALVFVIVNILEYDTKNSILSFLMRQLNKFENRLQAYLSEQVQSSKTYDNAVIDCMNKLKDGNDCNILNFNYTMAPVEENEVERNVHGSLSSHPILGIDAEGIPASSSYFIFTKTYRIMSLANGNVKQILPRDTPKIMFYGHSLSKADYSYFQAIFDHYNIYDSDTALIFYYSKYGSKSRSEVAQEQNDRISRLLESYGNTIPNHGDNLLHKLLLENRIMIKYLDDSM